MSDVSPARQCTLCRAEQVRTDFHHWDYENDDGVHVCRDCHDIIHESRRVRDQDPMAREKGWSDWREQAVKNVVLLDLGYNPTNISETHSRVSYAGYVAGRYNIDIDIVQSVLNSLLSSHPLEDWEYLSEQEYPGGES